MKSVSNIIAAALLPSVLLVASCGGSNNNYPEGYVGLDKKGLTHHYNVNNEEETITLKIVAAEKTKSDRVVKLSASSITIPGEAPTFQLEGNTVTVKADTKEASTKIKIFPKRVIKHSYIQVTCVPQWKDAESSQLVIRLEPK